MANGQFCFENPVNTFIFEGLVRIYCIFTYIWDMFQGAPVNRMSTKP